ncbi:hypothetical protein BRADI_4g03683v3 [Brachypodium distachyon]|uniref:Uncharacterized protein n=1 Tax=Brachypodium distachyon TaxID=15368 RepID=A0A2K2CK99_BRADI|nr:hypothetical protein BRADI_4g03683v3 [Brachypodium distachyon]
MEHAPSPSDPSVRQTNRKMTVKNVAKNAKRLLQKKGELKRRQYPTTVLPRAQGKLKILGNAQARCITWPRLNVVRKDGTPLHSNVMVNEDGTLLQSKLKCAIGICLLFRCLKMQMDHERGL